MKKYLIISKYDDTQKIKIWVLFFKNAIEMQECCNKQNLLIEDDICITDDTGRIYYDCFNGWHLKELIS